MSVSPVSNNSLYDLYNSISEYNKISEDIAEVKKNGSAPVVSDKEMTKEEAAQFAASAKLDYTKSLLDAFSGGRASDKKSSVPGGLSSLYESFGTLDLMRSGTFSKLVKSYYASLSGEGSAADSAAASKAASSSAADLRDSAKALGRDSLYSKKNFETKNEDGSVTATNDYDRAAIRDAVKSFVNDYNKTIEDIAETDDVRTLQKGVSMVGMTGAVSGLLSNVGISVGEDNQLSIDEEKLDSADITDIKTLFSGNYSYAATIAQKASMVANNASVSGYSANGSYNYTAYTNGIVNIQT